MPLPVEVFRKHDIAGFKCPPSAVAHLDVQPTLEDDNILTLRRVVPVEVVVARRVAKDDTRSGKRGGQMPDGPVVIHFDGDVFEVRLTVRARVYARDVHRVVLGTHCFMGVPIMMDARFCRIPARAGHARPRILNRQGLSTK